MQSINRMTADWALSRNIEHSFKNETTSTNDDAKSSFSSLGVSSALFLADHQTAGRGRFDRRWSDVSGGASLLSTWCFQSDQPVQPIFSPLVGLALFQSISFHFPSLQKELWVKPPNDLYVSQAKLCGLLIESSVVGNRQDIFIGLGINIFDKPKVDIPTTCLIDYEPIENQTWASFCQTFYDGVSEALSIAKKEELPPIKRNQLLTALNNHSQQYEKVFPNGDLKMKEQIISWQDL